MMNKKYPSPLSGFNNKSKPTGNNHSQDDNKQKKGNGLNLKLNRQLEVKRYPVIAELTFKRERQDLVSLLKATRQNPKTMPVRLIAYLKREQLWDSDATSLTAKGKKVIDTGFMDVKENGLYHIWYTHSDPLLGTRPLLIQRDTAFFEPNSKGWKSGADARDSGFSVSVICDVDVLEEIYDGRKTNQSMNRLTLKSLQPKVLCSPEASAQLDLEWQLGLKKSLVSLKGQLEVLDFAQKKKELKLSTFHFDINDYNQHLNIVMKTIAKQFNGQWNEKIQRMDVVLKEIQKYPQAIQRFEVRSHNISGLPTQQGTYKVAQVNNLPIKPEGHADAKHWHQAWLNDFHTKTYRSHSDAHQLQSRWLDHNAMADFDLNLQLGQDLLDSIGREKQPKSYWHVAAIEDLSPSSSKKQKLPFTLMNSEKLNIRDLMEQLTAGDSIRCMVYSDRYVYTSKQIRNLHSIASYVEGAEGLLMTLHSTKEKHDVVLPENWKRGLMNKQSDNHGRYWVFIGASHTWCWECTSGLDFIRQCDNGFIIDGTPGFTPKEEIDLPGYLQTTIKKMKTTEVM